MSDWTRTDVVYRSLVAVLSMLIGAIVLGWSWRLHPALELMPTVLAQLVPIALAVVVGFMALRRWKCALVAAAVLLLVTASMVPFWTASADPLPDDRETITVMHYNIFFGNDDFASIASHISASDADVVAVHELLPDQWDALEPLLVGYPFRIAEPLVETDGHPGGGMALLSKMPLDRVVVGPEMSPAHRVTLVATTTVGGHTVQIVGLHPPASRTDSAKVAVRNAQIDGVARLATESNLPMIVLTDLNITPTSPVYRQFLDDTGWRDPHRIVGWQSTWPTWGGPFGLPIDHVFVSNEFALHSYRTGDGAGSDHKSIVAVVSLDPG